MNRIFTSAINGNRDFDSSDITLGVSEIMPITPMMPTHTEKTLEVELKRKAKYLANPDSIFEETGPPFSLTSNFNRNEKSVKKRIKARNLKLHETETFLESPRQHQRIKKRERNIHCRDLNLFPFCNFDSKRR